MSISVGLLLLLISVLLLELDEYMLLIYFGLEGEGLDSSVILEQEEINELLIYFGEEFSGLLELLLKMLPLLQLLLIELLLDELQDELLLDTEQLLSMLLHEQHGDLRLDDILQLELQGQEEEQDEDGLL